MPAEAVDAHGNWQAGGASRPTSLTASWIRGLSRVADRMPLVVVTLATVWFALAAAWGVSGPVGGGHASVVASRGIAGENMLSWGILAPVREYAFVAPEARQYYVHHPWGTFWIIAGLMKVLGRHAWVVRLAPILMSAATPPLLYGVGRALWGPAAGALSALAYAVFPITLAFANFPGFEVPLVFGCLLTAWGYLRFAQRWRRRWMLVSLGGVLFTVNADWEGYVFVAVALAWLFAAAHLWPSPWRTWVPARRFGQWWGLSAGVAVATLAAYVIYFHHIGAIGEILSADALREKGADLPVAQVLASRRYWLDLMFTPVVIALARAAAPLLLFRLVVLRRSAEVFPLALLAMAAVEYVNFKQAADVHIYWPLPFAPYCALSVGVLAATAQELASFGLRRLERPGALRWVPLATVALCGALVLVVLPDGIEGLRYGRATGGRFDDRGRRISQDVDMSVALEWMSQQMQAPASVQVHASMRATWAVDWALRRPTSGVQEIPGPLAATQERYFVANLAFLSATDQRRLAAWFHLVTVGPFVLVDRQSPPAPVDGYALDAREPSLLERYLDSGTDPVRTVRADPWATWELRNAFEQSPNPAPCAAPTTAEELRIAHNVALAEGDARTAEERKNALLADLDTSVATTMGDGTVLIGQRYVPGVAPVLEVYFLATGPYQDGIQFDVSSTVTGKPWWSWVEADRQTRTVGYPLATPPALWRPGFVYVGRTEIRKRPGEETFVGYFTAPPYAHPPSPTNGSRNVALISLR